jgi:hypothetical protein
MEVQLVVVEAEPYLILVPLMAKLGQYRLPFLPPASA